MQAADQCGTYQQFGFNLVNTLSRDLGYSNSEATQITERVLAFLNKDGPSAYGQIHEYLVEQGIQHRWNGVFYHLRSAEIAKWILPHVEGKMIDLLSGSGKIGGILADMGLYVAASERFAVRDSYPDHARNVEWFDHDGLASARQQPKYDTVLLCTALHHEPNPAQLLNLAFKLASKRIIIVENCIEPSYPDRLQIFVDDFFNLCLNQSPLPCPARHLSAEAWADKLKVRARVVFTDRRSSMPGIPLAHTMMVAEVLGGPV